MQDKLQMLHRGEVLGLLINLATTFGAAWLGAFIYLFEEQRPRHRPFSRGAWPHTVLTGLWVAAVTTLSVTIIARFLPAVPPQALAFGAPVGVSAAKAS